MGGLTSRPRPLVLVAEYYGSGGTRTYIKQLLEFYGLRGRPVTLVARHPKPDHEIREILDHFRFGFRSYSEVMGMTDGGYAAETQPRIWSRRYQARERATFAALIAERGAEGIVVSAGTPGQFAGASSACARGMYILHTYPHGRRQQLLGRLVMAPMFQRTAWFVAVSEFQKREMVRLWGLSSRASDIDVVPNTVGPVLPTRERPSGLPHRVICASWVEPYKAPSTWLDVAELVTRRIGEDAVSFTWMGDGSMLDHMRKQVEARGLQGNVQFLGHVDHVAQAYAGATVYLQMSTTENMSLSVIEALRYGVPCVVTSVGGLTEIVSSQIDGVVVAPGDVDAAAEAVVTLVKSADAWSSMSAAGRRTYDERFSATRWEASMDAVHDRLFGPKTDDHSSAS
jgi:glycosyltransferase involved in cell wall biosynthesis